MQRHAAILLEREIPPDLRAQVARLYWGHFGRQILPVPVPARWGQALVLRAMRPEAAVLALDPTKKGLAGELVGMLGLRDAGGGFLALDRKVLQKVFGPSAGALLWQAGWLYRAAPQTADMVIDGIVVADGWRRQGVGARLIAQARQQALQRGYPGLRAEVAARNHAAVAFYAGLGFAPCGSCQMGWPWLRRRGGAVRIMRLAV